MRKLLTLSLLTLALIPAAAVAEERPSTRGVREAIDAYLDHRWAAPASATAALVAEVEDAGLGIGDVEAILRGGRASCGEPPQPRGRLTADVPLACEHVDHATRYFIYVPTGYDPARATPLVVVGHGGSSARDLAFGARAALLGIKPCWIEAAEREGLLLVAPLTDRGWGAIGNSILFSAISKVSREYNVNPDAVYVTGHSMGGHLSWRSAIAFPDRWGAVGPMSGGYDYVKSEDVFNLYDVPGYATYGASEPFQINEFNARVGAWMGEHRYPWVLREKPGGHEIFADEVPRVARFFLDHPRDLYRPSVFARGRGALEFSTPDRNAAWGHEHVWTSGRPIPASTFHWLRLLPLPADTPADRAMQKVAARVREGNAIEVTSENARRLRIYLHPRMGIDLARPVVVTANGAKVFEGRVAPSLATMLELAREFDDRGRIFQAAIDVEVATDRAVPEPSFRAREDY